MSLIADLFSLAEGSRAPTVVESAPPVPYTAPASNALMMFGHGAEPTQRHLDLTTTESTLLSVIDLIAGDTAAIGWDLYRGEPTSVMQAPDGVDPLNRKQHLAVKLWHQPNAFMTGMHYRSVLAWHFEAVGEAWAVCQYAATGTPGSFWPVRPDRMNPVTDPDKFLVGYVYTGPSGERIPLELNEVVRITRPHPLDPHRGIGPVPALVLPLTTSLTSQQWIQAFYNNDATPGGMIELGKDEILGDDDWNTLRRRWNEQHRGVNRAHRVGILEIGTFKPTVVDLQKLQVTEMRHLTRDQVLEAYRIHKHMIGASDDVNRANAEAADTTYARRVLYRRGRYWYDFANGPYLSCFGKTGQGVFFAPENIIPEDEAAENDERDSKVNAAKALTEAGFSRKEIAQYLDLPFTDTEDANPLLLANIAQKIYLAVGELGKPNAVLSTEEARRIMIAAGADLDNWTPPIIIEGERQPDPPQLPPAMPPPQLPPAAEPNDDPEGGES
jgi:HK97 family phage portal protein